MAVPLQVAAAGAYSMTKDHSFEVRLAETATAVGASATDVQGAENEAQAQDQSFVYVLSHDATAGQITIELQHADALAGTYTKLTNDAVIHLGERKTAPVAALVLDASLAENQGTILVGVSASGRELSGGQFVSSLKPAHRLVYTTDGSWNGTSINEIGISGAHRHQPGPSAD